MNLGVLQALIYKKLGDTTGSFWIPSEIVAYINEGIQDIAFRTKSIKTDSTFSAFAGIPNYNLQASFPLCLAITEVYYYNIQTLKWVKLHSTTRTELDETQPGWLSVPTSLPTRYWYDRELNEFYLYPNPDASYVSPNQVWGYYSIQSTDLSAPTDIPQIPQPIHLAIIDYATAVGSETRGWMDKAQVNWTSYYKRLADYEIERGRETEDNDTFMKSYRRVNI